MRFYIIENYANNIITCDGNYILEYCSGIDVNDVLLCSKNNKVVYDKEHTKVKINSDNICENYILIDHQATYSPYTYIIYEDFYIENKEILKYAFRKLDSIIRRNRLLDIICS